MFGGTMTEHFGGIPQEVIDYIRTVFREANQKVSRALSWHPSMHEVTLDHMLIAEVNAVPPAFFASSQAAVAIETHWLGSRGMFDRWEIADIAVVIILRQAGMLQSRKVALLQAKRLYADELAGSEIERADFEIGIGRLVDRVDPQHPLVQQRSFRFDHQCVYGALIAHSRQVGHIDAYAARTGIPVYYALYNPIDVPFVALYPAAPQSGPPAQNRHGCRILSALDVHRVLGSMAPHTQPSINDLTLPAAMDPSDSSSVYGWRIEHFIADEVLRCRQGRLFDRTDQPDLYGLLYGRSAPIMAAIAITIDLGAERPS